jgi:hypothetical protein
MSLSKRLQLIELYSTMANDGYQTSENKKIAVAFSDMEIKKFKELIKPIFLKYGIRSILDYGCGGSDYYRPDFDNGENAAEYFGLGKVFLYEPARGIDNKNEADAVVCFDVLEHVFISDIPETIRELFRLSRKLLVVNVACYKARALLPNGENAHITERPPMWWKGMFDSIAVEFPEITVQLFCSTTHQEGDAFHLYQARQWDQSPLFTTHTPFSGFSLRRRRNFWQRILGRI